MSKKAKRILIVHNYYREPGGEETYVLGLINLLKKSGFKVRLFKRDNRTLKNINLVEMALNLFFGRKTNRELDKVLLQFKPDLVHFNNLYPLIGPWAYRTCKDQQVPVVQTVHSLRYLFPWTYPGNPLTGVIYSLVTIFHRLIGSYKQVGLFIFPSEGACNYYLRNGGLSKGKTTIIPNFVSKGLTKKQASGFAFVGRLSKEKGFNLLLRAFPEEQELAMAGGRLKKRIGSITFLGSLSKKGVYRTISRARFVIVPSLVEEVLPTVVLEAYANATPVIAPGSGIFKKIVKNGSSGLLFKRGDASSLRKVIIAASQIQGRKYARMCQEAYRLYKENYTEASYVKKLLIGYNKLTDGNKINIKR